MIKVLQRGKYKFPTPTGKYGKVCLSLKLKTKNDENFSF